MAGIAGAFILAGCASTNLDDRKLSQIKQGETTEQELIRSFGRPASETDDGQGHRVLVWRTTEQVMPPDHAFMHDPTVPHGNPATRSKTVRVVLDSGGRVLKYDIGRNDATSQVKIQSE